MSKKVYEIITERIQEQLKNGVIPWRRPWVTTPPVNWATGRAYSGVNVFILGEGEFATFRQIQQAGGKVKKGAKAYPVVFWKFVEVEKTTVNAAGHEKVEVAKVPFLRYYSVFKISEQTEGLELRHAKPPRRGEEDIIPRCENIIHGYEDRPVIKTGEKAAYCPITDTVTIPERGRFYIPEEYYATLFHELIHSTGHPARLNRELSTRHNSAQYSREELVAALGAAFLCSVAGIINASLIENEAAYINGWLSFLRDDSKAFVWAAGRAQKAADYICGAREFAGIEETEEKED